MSRRHPWAVSVMCFALAAFLAVSLAGLSPAHRHARIAGGNCDICCAAHASAPHQPAAADVRPVVPVERHVASEPRSGQREPFLPADIGRAPPA